MFEISPYITFTILFAAMGVWGGYIVGVFISRRRVKKLRATLSTELAAVHHAREKLRRQMALVTDHSREYLHTLIIAEYPELEQIVATVDYAVQIAESLRNDGELMRALRVACWILDSTSPEPTDRRFTKEHRDIIASWRDRSKELLLQIADAIAHTHAENIDSGIRRRRGDRRPTDLDLQRLREGLLLD
jgi:hypothetical protein